MYVYRYLCNQFAWLSQQNFVFYSTIIYQLFINKFLLENCILINRYCAQVSLIRKFSIISAICRDRISTDERQRFLSHVAGVAPGIPLFAVLLVTIAYKALFFLSYLLLWVTLTRVSSNLARVSSHIAKWSGLEYLL